MVMSQSNNLAHFLMWQGLMKKLQYMIFIVIATIVLGLILSGCTSESKNMSVDNHHNNDSKTLNEEDLKVTVFSESASQADKQSEASRPLDEDGLPVTLPRGVYYGHDDWDSVDGLANAVWSGSLVVDGSCVYLDVSHILDDLHQDGYSIPKDVTLRSFLRFPKQLVHLDTATAELWVGEYGPMSSGDEVVVVGSGNSQQDWAIDSTKEAEFFGFSEYISSDFSDDFPQFECFADTYFYVMSMQSSNSYNERPALDITRSQLIAGLSWEIPTLIRSVYMEVILDIEPPCIYGVPLNYSGELYPDFDRLLLELPRPEVHLKIDKNSLWNNYFLWIGGTGPMKTGDIVAVSGVGHPSYSFPLSLELQEVGCSADGVLNASAGLSPVPNRYFQYSVLPTGT